ncbi:carbohydrate ABC transporter permease [Dactylosporangium siamense]|uniref:Sugar-transporter integral membrane protein n=1 Tax=Dactylosporangium siamense TaxID=685454 RepID=A0A919PKD9_9ACTN|nr:sugar ABC transporter permease [Dactylosporangium siamense]GIG45137.1 sugar-transporter integral membrane protein [Dactylosporangium siamense]
MTRRGGLAPIAWLAVLLYALFLVYPLCRSLFLSFTDRNPLKADSTFVGLSNYLDMLDDPRLLATLRFTLLVVVAVTVVANVFGLAFALLLNRNTANYRVMRTLIFIPQVLSGVIVAFIWRSILTQNGLLNAALAQVDARPVAWLGSTDLATVSICAVVSWMTIAFATVVYSAALRTVPPELYEAARVDGAGALERFRAVTLPMIAPGMTINVVLCLITTFKLYDVIAVLTGGGPANTTQSTAYYLLEVAFTQNLFGYSSAIAMLLLALTAGIAYTVTFLLRKREARL